MAIYEKLNVVDEDQEGPVLGAHLFGAVLRLWLLGDIDDPTAELLLGADAEADRTEMQSIQATFNAIGGNAGKAQFLNKLESVSILIEHDSTVMTKALARSILGF